MSDVALRLTITGRVQGVGYRDWAIHEARGLGLKGWVRNRRDGSVEAVVQGDDAAVERLLDWSRRGPPGARVTALEARPAPTDPSLSAFAIRPTIV